MSIIFGIIFIGLTLVAFGLLRGWALATLWGWFLVPLLHVPPIGISMAWGLSILVGLFTDQGYKKSDLKTNEEKVTAFIYYIIAPILSVVLGWLVLRFL